MNFFGNNNNFDFLAVGDITVDTFIRLKDAQILRDGNGKKPKLCLSFADKISYEEKYDVPAVGNAANAAVAASRLGLKSALATNVGGDHNGKNCIAALKRDNIDTKFVAINADKKTNHHFVLWFDDDRTILIKHEKYQYKITDFGSPKWIYFSSLGGDSIDFHDEIFEYFKSRPEIKLAFQPGTFQMSMGVKALAGIYKRTDAFFCNKGEAKRILKTDEDDILKLIKMIAALGPKITVITDGVAGAYCYDGSKALFMRPYPDSKPPLERTGAGDAFSSTFAAALALGMNVRDALKWAPINPMSVVQQIGAQAGLLTRGQIEAYLAKAPSDYEPKVIG